VADGGGLENR